MESQSMDERAEYVCDYEYGEMANALAPCSTCGHPIGRHRMSEPERFKKGPFKPPETYGIKLDGRCVELNEPRNQEDIRRYIESTEKYLDYLRSLLQPETVSEGKP